MGSIVLDLQADAVNPDVQTSDLLRKALMVAKKLKVREIEEWIGNELRGYRKMVKDFPAYREVQGDIVVAHPHHGPIPVMVGDPELADVFRHRPCADSVPEIENALEAQGSNTFIALPIPPEIQRKLMETMSPPLPTTYRVSPLSFKSILSAVRDTVLNWALQLEADGIIGEGLSFKSEDQKRAATAAYQVNNFFNQVSGSQFTAGEQNHPVQINTFDIERVREGIPAMREAVEHHVQDVEKKAEIEAEIEKVEAEVSSSKPKRGVVKAILGSIFHIAEEAAGHVAAVAILHAVGVGVA